MPVETLNCIPVHIECATTVRFTVSFPDFPANLWNATLKLQLNGAAPTSYAASADGTAFAFVLTSTQTDALTPGTYNAGIYATEISSSEVARVWAGVIRLDNYIGEAQTLSFWQTTLTSLQTAYGSISTGKMQSATVNGQSYTQRDLRSMQDAITHAEARVLAEQRAQAHAAGVRSDSTYQATFAPAHQQYPACGAGGFHPWGC